MEGFLRYRFGGLIFGGAYFRNFKVNQVCLITYVLSNLLPAINLYESSHSHVNKNKHALIISESEAKEKAE